MSVTTTQNTVSASVLQVLADYDLHHSGAPEQPGQPAPPNERDDLAISSSNPPGWPTDHRRVPPYRPINCNLDRDVRPGGANFIEAVFIATLLNGVRLNANVSHLWRATGGQINDRIFRYKIGGEW